VGEVQTVSKPGRPAEAGGGPPSGLGQGLGLPRPYAANAAGLGSIALQRDLQSCLARKQNTETICQVVILPYYSP
jgi:hypothetical protein